MKVGKKCKIDNCKCNANPKKGGLCNHHYYEKEKNLDPVKFAYQAKRRESKYRGIPFTISLEDFREFCYETDILHGRGRTSKSWHIDRIIDELGYAKGNLQKLTCAENTAKENRRRKIVKYDWQTKEAKVVESNLSKPIDYDVPF